MFPPSGGASNSAAIRGLMAARSAAALKNMQSPTNIGSLDDVYSVDPHASASAMLSSEANAGRATDALINLGGGAQRLGLVNSMSDARLAHANDESDQLADLSSGVPQRIAQQKLAGQDALAAQASEDAAARELAPNRSAVNAQQTAAKMQQLFAQYTQPKQVEGQTALGVEGAKAQSALDLQRANNDPQLLRKKALLNVLAELAKTGKVDPDQVSNAADALGINPDGTPRQAPIAKAGFFGGR